jgi:hypothetical protein
MTRKHPTGAVYVELEPELKEAVDRYCVSEKCTLKEFVEDGAKILLSSKGDEMVRLCARGKVYTVPLSLAKIYESIIEENRSKK